MSEASNIILGIEGTKLSANEFSLFSDIKPLGMIFFARNLESADQIKALCDDFRNAVQNEQALILIDQEGGRVSRLPAAEFRIPPSPTEFASLFQKDPEAGLKACFLNHICIGYELKSLGINVNCAPMLDIPQTNADKVVSERAFGSSPKDVIALAEKAILGMQTCGVEPVIKHGPGHGRATADSHKELPIVDASFAELDSWDFMPFKAFKDQTMLMSAHILYPQIDKEFAGTQSRIVIEEVIRQHIGFNGLIMTDDIDMHALKGSVQSKAKQAFDAGCDVVLQCSGEFDKMKAVSEVASELSGKSLQRAILAQQSASREMADIHYSALLDELDQLLM